jgi:hypothetical protein
MSITQSLSDIKVMLQYIESLMKGQTTASGKINFPLLVKTRSTSSTTSKR